MILVRVLGARNQADVVDWRPPKNQSASAGPAFLTEPLPVSLPISRPLAAHGLRATLASQTTQMNIHQAHFTPVRNFTERGVFKTLLLENPRIKSEGVALIDASSGATTTYKDLISSSLRFGSGISKQLPPGSTLLISSQNSTVYPSLLFGALAAGVIASTANPAYTPSELSHQILDSDAKLILASSDLREVAREAAHLAGLLRE